MGIVSSYFEQTYLRCKAYILKKDKNKKGEIYFNINYFCAFVCFHFVYDLFVDQVVSSPQDDSTASEAGASRREA